MDVLEQRGKLKAIGGASYLTGLTTLESTSLHAEHYAGIVEREYIKRKAVQFGANITQWAYKSEDAHDLLAKINRGLLDLEMQQDRGGPVPVARVVSELFDDLEQWQNDPLAPGQVRGLSTGIPEWDGMMGGMENGESLVILAARPRTGKTILALTSAYRMAKAGKRVLIFALEMKGKTLVARLASADSQVSYKRVKRGARDGSDWYASMDEFSKFTTTTLGVSQATNLYIDESMDLTISQIRSRAMTLAHRLGGLDLIVIDTGNLVRGEDGRGKNFAQTESDKVRGIRNLIKELDCVGYVTWQLNKGVDSRPVGNMGRAPTLGDLRDTGGVEEHASDVIGLYRDDLYNENSQYKNMMHLFALKRRNDEDSTIKILGFDPQYQRFYSVEIHRNELVI
jgi:replicative DNA helicase